MSHPLGGVRRPQPSNPCLWHSKSRYLLQVIRVLWSTFYVLTREDTFLEYEVLQCLVFLSRIFTLTPTVNPSRFVSTISFHTDMCSLRSFCVPSFSPFCYGIHRDCNYLFLVSSVTLRPFRLYFLLFLLSPKLIAKHPDDFEKDFTTSTYCYRWWSSGGRILSRDVPSLGWTPDGGPKRTPPSEGPVQTGRRTLVSRPL